MSSAGNFGGGEMAGDSPQNYYCYGCQRTVTLTPLPNSELSCPNCNSTFLEESENIFRRIRNRPASRSYYGNNSFGDGIPIAFPTASGGSDGGDFSPLLGGGAFPGQPPIEIDPVVHTNSYSRDGASILSMLESNLIAGGGSEYRLPENFDDNFLRHLRQLQQRIQRRTASLNRHGTPAAAKWAVSGLPDVKVSDELLSSQCAVCKDSFKVDELVKQMPCKHIYHKDCILPWLEMRNSCPVCRYELPTDDSDYENRRTSRQSTDTSTNTNTNNDGNNAGLFYLDSEGRGNPRTVERSVRISLPGLLRGLESHAETSNSGGEGSNNDGNDSSSNNTHEESNPCPEGQDRQEDS